MDQSILALAITAPMAYTNPVIIVETPIFTKQVLSTLTDEEYRSLQSVLVERPDAGQIIAGSGGLRKLRWSATGRGKRGGVRVIYYSFTVEETLLLLFIYPKNVQDNLTPDQLKQLRNIIEKEYHAR